MAAGPTYEPIQTISSNGTSPYYFEFTSIPSTYTDLILIIYTKEVGQDGLNMQLSTSGSWQTGNNYQIISLGVNSAGSTGSSNYATTFWEIGLEGTVFANTILHIQNYSATNMWKTFLCDSTAPNFYTRMTTGTYTGTGAIDGLRIWNGNNTSHTTGSTATIYGIREA